MEYLASYVISQQSVDSKTVGNNRFLACVKTSNSMLCHKIANINAVKTMNPFTKKTVFAYH